MDLLVLAKEPRPGRVKTRLCPPCTHQQAAAIAEAALADTLQAALASGADRVLLALDGDAGEWCPPGVEVVPQGGGDLADRLTASWRATTGPALQIGMDTPHVSSGVLRASLERLQAPAVDAVLGLARDGGWWGIGFAGPAPPEVFRGIPTSQPDTGTRQDERLRELGLRRALLPPLVDVDTWVDALEVASAHPALRFSAAVRAVEQGAG